MTPREQAERLLAEHREDATYPDSCLCETEVPAWEGHYAAHDAQVLDEAGLLAELACCCESSPPEFGGNLPDRECPLHGEDAQPAAAPSEDAEALAETICNAHAGDKCKPWRDEDEAWRDTYRDMARAVLASDWLAAHDAEVRRETLRQAHDEIHRLNPPEYLDAPQYREGLIDGHGMAAAVLLAMAEAGEDRG